jgi:hypothetical protein
MSWVCHARKNPNYLISECDVIYEIDRRFEASKSHGFQSYYPKPIDSKDYVEGECLSQKWTISHVKQGKFKVGVVPADGLGRLLIKIFCIH